MFHIATYKSNYEGNYYIYLKQCQERILIMMEVQSVSLIWGHYENILLKTTLKADFIRANYTF